MYYIMTLKPVKRCNFLCSRFQILLQMHPHHMLLLISVPMIFYKICLLKQGLVERVAVIFFNTDNIPVEKYIFKLNINQSYSSNVKEGALEFTLRSFLIKLSVSQSLSRVLPDGKLYVHDHLVSLLASVAEALEYFVWFI